MSRKTPKPQSATATASARQKAGQLAGEIKPAAAQPTGAKAAETHEGQAAGAAVSGTESATSGNANTEGRSGAAREATQNAQGTDVGTQADQETGQTDVGAQPAAHSSADPGHSADQGGATTAEGGAKDTTVPSSGDEPDAAEASEAEVPKAEVPKAEVPKAPVFPKSVVGRKGAAAAFGIAEEEVLDFSWTKDRLVVVTVAGQKLRVEADAAKAGVA